LKWVCFCVFTSGVVPSEVLRRASRTPHAALSRGCGKAAAASWERKCAAVQRTAVNGEGWRRFAAGVGVPACSIKSSNSQEDLASFMQNHMHSRVRWLRIAVSLFLHFRDPALCRLKSFAKRSGHRSTMSRGGFVFALSAFEFVPPEVLREDAQDTARRCLAVSTSFSIDRMTPSPPLIITELSPAR